ncbi:MAG TPA: hypothetical protein VFV73_28315 [Streptosporangiaceae bacterium]|nr:hypothetical protein [Streptosporangiaceae bacterium]
MIKPPATAITAGKIVPLPDLLYDCIDGTNVPMAGVETQGREPTVTGARFTQLS